MATVCGETCEVARWFGVAGVCNTTTLECMCPDGYHGIDDWNMYNDCHVPISLQRLAWGIQACTHILCLAVGLWGFAFLTRHWNFVGKMKTPSSMRLSRNFSNSKHISVAQFSMDGAGGEDSPRQSFFRRPRTASYGSLHQSPEQKQWQRQRDTLVALIVLLLYVSCGVAYVIPYFMDQYLFEKYWYQRLGVCIGAPAILSGLWGVTYIWYRTLPSLRLYGKLFDIKSVLIRYPNAVKRITFFSIGLIYVVGIVLLFVIPMSTEDDEIRKLCEKIFHIAAMGFLINFFLFFTALLVFLRGIFTQLIQLSESTKTSLDTENVKSSIAAINLMIIADIMFAPFSTVAFGLMGLSNVGSENIWFFLNTLAIIGDFAAMLAFYILARKLAGPKVGRSRSPSQASSTSSPSILASPTSMTNKSHV